MMESERNDFGGHDLERVRRMVPVKSPFRWSLVGSSVPFKMGAQEQRGSRY